jgi:hypothetical protein|uniref:DUF4902 domain-containing protein n=1 Tax=mine drainage metagenome TaxID=410659 RepID=E6QVK6_9ZZZZ
MNYQTDAAKYPCDRAPIITLSEDGYVRLTLETFLVTPLVHLVSGLDEDSPNPSQEGGSLARISGYTEWVSASTPIITLGWDWWLDVSRGKFDYVRSGAPRCNVMLVDAMQRDLGSVQTLGLLEAAIDGLAWREEVQKQIVTRYA